MTRSVTVQFADGTSHTYDNVPDDVTPDQIEARAQGEFKDRQIQHISRAPLEGEAPAEKPQAEKDLETLQSEQIPEAMGYGLGALGLGYGVAEEGLKGTRNAIKWAERALAGRQPQVGINPNIPAAPTAPGNLAPTQKYGQAMHGGVYTPSLDMSDIYQAGKEATHFQQANPSWEVKQGSGLAVPKPSLAEQRAQINAERAAEKTIQGRAKQLGSKIAESTPAKAAGLFGRIAAPAYGGYQLGTQGTKAYNRLTNPQGAGDVAAGITNIVGAGAGATSILPGKYRLPGAIVSGLSSAAADALATKRKEAEEKATGGLVGYAGGSKVVQGGLEAAKKLFVPKPTKVVRASEALGPHEGKYLNLTQSDRMRSTGGDLGGPGFSKFQLENPDYAGAAWGVGNKPTASGIVNINKRYPEGQAIWAPMIGSEAQHRSNQHVYDALTDEFNRQVSMGKLTPELREAMNKRLASTPKYSHLGLNEIDVANPEHVKNLGNTFDRRAAISEVLGGEGVGGRKGQIFDYPGVMQEMTDPMTIGAPTHSMGTRLFTLSNEVEHRPDLHSAFPFILKGEDMGVAFNPVPKELAYPSWINMAKEFTGREPGYMELTRGIKGQGKPFQFIDEKYLRTLEEAGHAEGGQIQGYAGGKKVIEAGLKALEPEQTVKAYKLFRTDPKAPESLFPLFVNANKPVPIGQWLPAEAGELTQAGKVKSKIGDLAYRPGWHAGDMPIATHIGGKSSPDLTAPDFRPSNQVWAEVEMPADVDWQSIAMERAQRNKAGDIIPRTAHITDTIPEGGHYRYKTNPNMTGDWLIGGSMKVNRVLTPEEVMAINEAKGVADLPRFEPLPKKAEGGSTTPAWQRKEGKNPEGGLNAIGRASYNRETGGNLKAPQPEGGPRKKSFCARMEGMKKKNTSAETANDPDSRINKSLRKWKC